MKTSIYRALFALLLALVPYSAFAQAGGTRIQGVGTSSSPIGGAISIYCVSGCGSTTPTVFADTGAAQRVEGVGASGAPIGGVISVNCVGGCSGGGGSVSVTAATPNIIINPTPGTGTFTVGATAPINAQTGTTYAVLTTDGGKLVTFSNASAVAVSLSQATTTGFGAGFSFDVQNKGAGLVTITPATSTINGAATLTIPQNTGCTVTSDGVNFQVSACTSIVPITAITGLGAGVATLLGGASSGTGGPAGTTSPTFTTPVLGAATGTSIVLSGSLTAGAASVINWTGEAKISSPADGTLLFTNNAATAFTRLLFGCATSSCPAFNVSGAGLVARLADNSANAAFTSGALSASGAVTLSGVTTGTNADFLCLTAGFVVTLQTTACTISSKRFKTQLGVFDDSALAELDNLPVGIFTMKGPPNADPNFKHVQIGLYAEDVARMDPRCSIYEDDLRTPKSYRQECIIALLVKGEQELKASNDNLSRQVVRAQKARRR